MTLANPNILVTAPDTFFGDWSSFSCCFSIKKYLPECKIFLQRDKAQNMKRFFNWQNKLKVKKTLKDVEYDVTLPSWTVMVRSFNDNFDISEAQEDKITQFVSYKDGCGKFVMGEWIDKREYPFPHADSFVREGMNVNEVQILKLWKQMDIYYPLLARG
jgi:hypothetical protein